MEHTSRHQCLIYEGAPSEHLAVLAAVVRDKLHENYCCLYLNSDPMVAGMRSYLAAAGLNVEQETKKVSLLLSSSQAYLNAGHFDIGRMLDTLEDTLSQALSDGYAGLWAAGDMTWEMGPDGDFSKLLEYERQLEEMFSKHPQLCGICQYHADTLPREVMRQGLAAHRSLFVNQTLSLMNPHYTRPESLLETVLRNRELDAAVRHLCEQGNSIDGAAQIAQWPA